MSEKPIPTEAKPSDSTATESTSTNKAPSTEANTSKPTSNINMSIAAPKRPSSADETPANTYSKRHGGNGLATTAIVLALIAVVAGVFLWNELSTVQRELADTTGLDQSELNQIQSTLEQNSENRTDQTTAELKTLVAEAQKELESEIKESLSQLENNINSISSNVKQQDANTAALVATTRELLKGELNQATTKTNDVITQTDGTLSELKGSFSELKLQVQNRLDSTIASLDTRLKSTEDEQTKLQLIVQRSQEELTQAIGKNRTDWALNEVEHILSIANNQVSLERSPVKAITSLRTAKQRLQNIDNPQLTKIREAVNTDIAALESLKTLDLHNTSLMINRLAGEAGKLRNTVTKTTPAVEALATEAPIAKEENIASTSLLAIKGFASAAWQGLSAGVTIAEGGEVIAPLLPPEHAFFLQQNLQLKLESARLALLRQDDANFHSSIAAARDWTQRYFDAKDDTTQQFIKDLNSLDALKLDPTLPDISNSLRVLREIKPSLS
ncbi:MAG: hypothetical protein GXP14_10030 [Gammaproteobacteria bacterium]|nr:hypothetical protein [Gammaproteobacteria bacterium]